MASSFGGTIKLQGESEYRKALKDITSNLKLMSSELKLTNTAFSTGDKSVKQTKASYESMNKAVQEQKTKVTEMREALSKMEKEYGSNNEKVKTFKTQLNNAENQLKQMEDATDKSTKELKEMKTGFDDAGQGAVKFGDLLKANILGDAIVGGIKALGSAVAGVGKAFINLGKQAIEGYADFEQLEGGVKKLFGEEMAETVKKNANDAFKTAGMTANEYMETVTGFSASMINSLNGDTKKAAELSDMAIKDMSDNASTFGTDLSSLQNAYQGFAKGQFNMLDNLKLGYGGTKTEMERLLADATKISGIKYDISSFADITEAIHIMQEEMKIAGTTSAEASKTISGSLSATKSAWSNLITGLADDNANFEQLMGNLMESLLGKDGEGGLINNILPRIEIVMNSIITMIPTLLETLLPKLLTIGTNLLTTLLTGITNALPNILPTLTQAIMTVVQAVIDNLPMILQAGITILVELVKGISQSLPTLIPAIVDALILIVETLIDNIDMIIDAGIQLIFALADGLIEALPRLIEKAPVIIEKLFDAIIRNLPKIFQAGGELIGKLVMGITGSFGKLLEKAPEIVGNLVKGILGVREQMKNAGKNLIEGLWNGISGMASWVYDKVKGFADNIVGNVKKVLGIHSPSKVFEEQVGKNMALGIGEGFGKTMSDVSKEMESSIPTKFDTNVNMKSTSSTGSNYDNMVGAFKKALTDVKVVMNDREMGTFVADTMTNIVYS